MGKSENTDDEKLEAAVFELADLQTMLSEKLALISHTLEVDSPGNELYLNQQQSMLTRTLNMILHFSFIQQFTAVTLHPRPKLRTVYRHCRSLRLTSKHNCSS